MARRTTQTLPILVTVSVFIHLSPIYLLVPHCFSDGGFSKLHFQFCARKIILFSSYLKFEIANDVQRMARFSVLPLSENSWSFHSDIPCIPCVSHKHFRTVCPRLEQTVSLSSLSNAFSTITTLVVLCLLYMIILLNFPQDLLLHLNKRRFDFSLIGVSVFIFLVLLHCFCVVEQC